jgi:hypothetical protein
MKNKNLTLTLSLLLLGASQTFFAQSAIVPTGGDAVGEGGSMSFTVGQIDYIVATGEGGSLFQGIQQPFIIEETLGLNEKHITLSASVHPNPTADYVILSISESDLKNMNFILSDAQGKQISSGSILQDESQITMSQLSAGMYFLNIQTDGKNIKIFKIIKKQ